MIIAPIEIIDFVLILLKYVIDRNNPLIGTIHSLFPLSFFIFLIVGNLVPLFLMRIYRDKEFILYKIVPLLVIFGVLLKRAESIIPVYFRRWLPFASDVYYVPTLPESLLVIGVYSGGIAGFVFVFLFLRSIVVRKN